jgi:hypothetical protein
VIYISLKPIIDPTRVLLVYGNERTGWGRLLSCVNQNRVQAYGNRNTRELIAYLEAENAKLRGRASKLTSQVQALRAAVGDFENTPRARQTVM